MRVTQMNHLVMEIDCEPYRDWFSSQVRAAELVTRAPQRVRVHFPASRTWLPRAPGGASLGLPVASHWEG